MKRTISIFFMSIFLSGCIDENSVDCAQSMEGNFMTEFKVSEVHLGEEMVSKYLSNEDRYNNKNLELKTNQEGDTLKVKFLRLGGNANINCVEIRKSNSKIDVINYESNYLKEVAMRKIEYRIPNMDKFELGKIEFVELKKQPKK